MPSNQHEADKKAGFTEGKRVWLANNWDGALLTRRLGTAGRNLTLSSVKPDPYGRLLVELDDGTFVPVRKDLLRLSPPPSLSGKNAKAKETKPKARKEAITALGAEETTIFEHGA